MMNMIPGKIESKIAENAINYGVKALIVFAIIFLGWQHFCRLNQHQLLMVLSF